MPTKTGLHAFHVNLYLHEFFEPILFSDPHGLYNVHMVYSLYSVAAVLWYIRPSTYCPISL